MHLRDKSICVTGGEGFIGSAIVERLQSIDCKVFIPSHKNFDLRRRDEVERMYVQSKPDVVFHAAGAVGGIGANKANPAKFFYDNMVMGLEIIDVGHKFGVKKIIQVGTSCAYPKHTPQPLREACIWDGYPEEVTAPYGVAKRALLVMGQAYREQYDMDIVQLMPSNVYGPRESFDLDKSHVLPALIMKCLKAQETDTPLVVWGTGKATRDFIYIDDCVDAFVLAAENYSGAMPLNLGAGIETSISELVNLVVEAVGFKGPLEWDTTKPEGKARSWFDMSLTKAEIGFNPKTKLRDGIRKTVEWYRSQR